MKSRIDARIRKMVFGPDRGLKEAFDVFEKFGEKAAKDPEFRLDFTKGVLQAIGYKELYPLYQYIK